VNTEFKILAQSSESGARSVSFKTPHGPIQGPLFMPVATRGALRHLPHDRLVEFGTQVLLSNTFHFFDRPGVELLKTLGPLHRFIKWAHPILTDSGGFQVFSLAKRMQLSEEGARFRSPFDGRELFLGPEESLMTQDLLGSDIRMVLDVCIPSTASRDLMVAALEQTTRWARRSFDTFQSRQRDGLLFAIVQGGLHLDLRTQSRDQLSTLNFDGFALGGLAVGESFDERITAVNQFSTLLPADKPRYLMGVGTPIDLLESVRAGIDMFDCIMPLALAQQGRAFTSQGHVLLRRAVYKSVDETLDPNCSCPTCTTHSLAYLNHLVKCQEPMATYLIAQHNVYFYHHLMFMMRSAILENRFEQLYQELRQRIDADDPRFPIQSPKVHAQNSTFQIETIDGLSKVRSKETNEVIHARENSDHESQLFYIEANDLKNRLTKPDSQPFVVWDVGLGAGHNAFAALKLVQDLAARSELRRPVQMVSVELNPEIFRLVLSQSQRFGHLQSDWATPLLADGKVQDSTLRLEWSLIVEDFAKAVFSLPKPDAIFFDPYSYKTQPELWTDLIFAEIYKKMKPGATLSTYASGSNFRTMLKDLGFDVNDGPKNGVKHCTVAMKPYL
jgi:queuine tRNA-ribosyltransferase